MSSPPICTEIVKCLESFWSTKQLIDFTVKIDKESIECHRFILAACSEFFQALFNSKMKEVKENCVVLSNISVAVFELVLKAIYTGVNVLTLENVLEVWRAVHQLQIRFLIHLCEEFAIKYVSIDTWENTYKIASLLDSKPVLRDLHLFMLKNFEKICHAPTFLLLPFDEVNDLIKSQDLVISREDLVLESVINWVNYDEDIDACGQLSNANVDNQTKSNTFDKQDECDFGLVKSSDGDEDSLSIESDEQYSGDEFNMRETKNMSRRSKLTELLKLVRTCLVSPTVLSRVFKHKLIIENEDARNIIFNASMYHSLDVRHGQWPSTAVHRLSSEYKHYGVYASSSGTLYALNLYDKKWYTLSNNCNLLQGYMQLVAFNNDLYAVGMQNVNYPNGVCRMCMLFEDNWLEVAQMPSKQLLLVSHGHFIFIINKEDKVIYTIKPTTKKPKMEKFTNFPDKIDAKHAMIFENWLLLFVSSVQNNVEETAIYMLDIHLNIWTRLDNINGPAEEIVSFNNDVNFYILQTNGNLWQLIYSTACTEITFKFIIKLWSFTKKMHGALTFNNNLFVFGNDPSKDPTVGTKIDTVSGHIQNIQLWGVNDYCSNFIPITLQSKFFKLLT